MHTSHLLIFIKVAHVGSNQQLTCVYIPWHEPIILTKLNQEQHVVFMFSAEYIFVATYLFVK